MVVLAACVAIVLFAVANRQPVTVGLLPLQTHKELDVTVPLYAVMFAAVAVGLLIGRAIGLTRRRRL